MADPGFTVPDKFSEVYEVVRAFEVCTLAGRRFRIEIVRALRGRTHEFCAHYAENVNDVWTTPLGVGWVSEDDLDLATHYAFGWLASYANAHKRDAQ
jgi:hypothetical protein